MSPFQVRPSTEPWAGVAPSQWLDWRWQLQNSLRGAALAEHFGLDAQTTRFVASGSTFENGVTPFFADLCDRHEPDCALRLQVVPDAAELQHAPFELADPLGEDGHRVAPGVVRKYPDRVLLLVTDTCAAYCRFCTRSRWVAGDAPGLDAAGLDAAIEWIAAEPAIADVLISGGDPLLLSSRRLESLLDRLAAIDHLRLIRIGSRAPIFLPMRVDEELVHALRPRRIPIWLNLHVNHPREIAPELTRQRLALLADAGIPLGGQTVLLRGVNDDVETLRETFFAMVGNRVRPYYLLHCDPVLGTAHLRVSVRRGLELMSALTGHVSGMAVPKYCVDLEGGGKVQLVPDAIERIDAQTLRITGFDGVPREYPDC